MSVLEPNDEVCAGCGGMVPGREVGTVWIDAPLGLCAVKTHRVQECAALAVAAHAEQPAKRVPRPLTKAEKDEVRGA